MGRDGPARRFTGGVGLFYGRASSGKGIDMAEITFACPGCQQHLSADDDMAGQQLDCPSCGQALVVPGEARIAPWPDVSTTPSSLPGRRRRRWPLVLAVALLVLVPVLTALFFVWLTSSSEAEFERTIASGTPMTKEHEVLAATQVAKVFPTWAQYACRLYFLEQVKRVAGDELRTPSIDIKDDEFSTSAQNKSRRERSLSDYKGKVQSIYNWLTSETDRIRNMDFRLADRAHRVKYLGYNADTETLTLKLNDNVGMGYSINNLLKPTTGTSFFGFEHQDTETKLTSYEPMAPHAPSCDEDRKRDRANFEESVRRLLTQRPEDAVRKMIADSIPVLKPMRWATESVSIRVVDGDGSAGPHDEVTLGDDILETDADIVFRGVGPDVARCISNDPSCISFRGSFSVGSVTCRDNGSDSGSVNLPWGEVQYWDTPRYAWRCKLVFRNTTFSLGERIYTAEARPSTTSPPVTPERTQPLAVPEKRIASSRLPTLTIAPKGEWERVDDPDSECLLRLHHMIEGASDEYDERVVVYGPYPETESLEQRFAGLAAHLRQDGFVFRGKEAVRAASWTGVHSTWDLRGNAGHDLRCTRSLVAHDGQMFIMSCFALRSEWNEWEQRFRDAVKSLTIDAASHGTVGRGKTETERDVRSDIEHDNANGYRVDQVKGSTNELQFAGKMRLPDGRVTFHVRCNERSHFVEKGETFAGMYSVQGYTERQERVMDDVLKRQRTVDTSVLVLSAGQESIRLERGKPASRHQCHIAVFRHISTGQTASVRQGESVTLGGQRLSILGVAPDGRVSARNRDTGKEFTAVPH